MFIFCKKLWQCHNFWEDGINGKRNDVSGFVNNSQWINAVMPCPDNSMLSKIAIHKSSEREPEKEWRLFCSNNRPDFF